MQTDHEGQKLLLPTAKTDTGKESLSDLLYRIGKQCGSFRNVTASGHVKDESVEEVKTEPVTLGGDSLRQPILDAIAAALNECALALDATSLLLSASRPSAEQTISPALKQNVPLASFAHGYSLYDMAPQYDADVARGHKKHASYRAFTSLQEATAHAEGRQEEEEKKWQVVQDAIEEGWTVHPREDEYFIRYGSEAADIVSVDSYPELIRPEDVTTMRFELELDGHVVASSREPQPDDSISLQTTSIDAKRQLTRLQKRYDRLKQEIDDDAELGRVEDGPSLWQVSDRICVRIRLDSSQSDEAKDEVMSDDDHQALLMCFQDCIKCLQASGHMRSTLIRITRQFRLGQAVAEMRHRLTTMVGNLQKYSWTSLQAITLEGSSEDTKTTIFIRLLQHFVTVSLWHDLSKGEALRYTISINDEDEAEADHWTEIQEICHYTICKDVMSFLVASSTNLRQCYEMRLMSHAGRRAAIIIDQDAIITFQEVTEVGESIGPAIEPKGDVLIAVQNMLR